MYHDPVKKNKKYKKEKPMNIPDVKKDDLGKGVDKKMKYARKK